MSGILELSSIVVEGSATNQADAIDEAGSLLVAAGAVEPGYIQAMHEREKSISTFMGNGLAIPHGVNVARSLIKASALCVVRYPGGIDWSGHQVRFVVGIAGVDNEHLTLLGRIAEIFIDDEAVARLEQATTAEEIWAAFQA